MMSLTDGRDEMAPDASRVAPTEPPMTAHAETRRHGTPAVVGLVVVMSGGTTLVALDYMSSAEAMAASWGAMFSLALHGTTAAVAVAWARRRRRP